MVITVINYNCDLIVHVLYQSGEVGMHGYCCASVVVVNMSIVVAVVAEALTVLQVFAVVLSS